MSVSVSPPTAAPVLDAATGFALLPQPVTLTATSPILASGSPLTAQDPASKLYLLDPTIGKAGFTFGALLYRTSSAGIEIFDGAHWMAQTAFDPSSPSIKPAAFGFDPKGGAWSAKFLLSSAPDATDPAFLTASPKHPKYGFLSVFTTPKANPSTAARSALGKTFGVTAANSQQRVQPGLVQGYDPTQDPKSADGFAVIVNDAGNARIADLIVSSASGVGVLVRLYSGGVVRASMALEPDGNVHLKSATQITLEAPNVEVTGTLQAGNIEYVPYGGSGSKFL
jgi:hypothetical protein